MKASELRCGNIVTINNPKYYPEFIEYECKVIGVEEKEHTSFPESKHTVKLQYGLNTYNQFEEFIEPIPLTEEWLLRFGYTQNKTAADMFEDETRLNIWRSPNDFNGFIADWDALTLRAIEFVHQLQNLYFSLTGEELTLKQE